MEKECTRTIAQAQGTAYIVIAGGSSTTSHRSAGFVTRRSNGTVRLAASARSSTNLDGQRGRRSRFMGENADDMIDGLTCSHCGIFFEAGDGYPVLCRGCFKKDKGKSGIPKSRLPELGGSKDD